MTDPYALERWLAALAAVEDDEQRRDLRESARAVARAAYEQGVLDGRALPLPPEAMEQASQRVLVPLLGIIFSGLIAQGAPITAAQCVAVCHALGVPAAVERIHVHVPEDDPAKVN